MAQFYAVIELNHQELMDVYLALNDGAQAPKLVNELAGCGMVIAQQLVDAITPRICVHADSKITFKSMYDITRDIAIGVSGGLYVFSFLNSSQIKGE